MDKNSKILLGTVVIGGAFVLLNSQKAKPQSLPMYLPNGGNTSLPPLTPLPTLPANNANNNLFDLPAPMANNTSFSLTGGLQLHTPVSPFLIRGNDSFGSGAYNARRNGGKRKHKAIDLVAQPNVIIESPLDGVVTKIGKAYRKDNRFKTLHVQGTGMYKNIKVVLMYVNPLANVGSSVSIGDAIATAQNIGLKYTGITPHVHYEVKEKNWLGLWANVNPLKFHYDV